MNIDNKHARQMELVTKHENLVLVCTYSILFTNDIVCGLFIDATSQLEKSPLYRHKTKQAVNKCKAERYRYENLLNKEILKERADYFAEGNDIFSEHITPHIEKLYYAMKQVLDNHKIPNSSVIARLELTRTICDLACEFFDNRMEDMTKTDRRFSKLTLNYLRMTTMLRRLNALVCSLPIHGSIDMNTPNTKLAMQVVMKEMMNVDVIVRAIFNPKNEIRQEEIRRVV